MGDLNYLFLDFNAYFASVEQQLRPSLRGKPVGVVPVMTDSSSCIAASYEAKAYGIGTGTGVGEARRLCPGIRLLQARPSTYVELHHQLVALVESCMHVDAVLSIDEMTCPLTGKWRERGEAEALAHEIKAKLRRDFSAIKCSIGLSTNGFLAKTAAELHKPDGLTVLERGDLPDALLHLKLDDLCGIGKNRLRHLHASGIYTMDQLYRASVPKLRKVWGGVEGERMHALLRGHEVWRPPQKTTTIGHSHVLPPHLRTPAKARSVFHKLLQKAAMRLRQGRWMACRVHLQLKYFDGYSWEDQMKILETQHTRELADALDRLYARRAYPQAKPLAVGVSLSGLVPEAQQTVRLFPASEAKNEQLDAAMDKINQQYGNGSVFWGEATEAIVAEAAPMRISFTHIPHTATEEDRARSR